MDEYRAVKANRKTDIFDDLRSFVKIPMENFKAKSNQKHDVYNYHQPVVPVVSYRRPVQYCSPHPIIPHKQRRFPFDPSTVLAFLFAAGVSTTEKFFIFSEIVTKSTKKLL